MQDSESNWINIADVMSALMMIFMFISISFLYQLLSEEENYKIELNKALHEEFDKDLVKWQALITDDNIMRFNSPFETGGAQVPEAFYELLQDFFPRYIKVLSNAKFKSEIDEIRVEGHTSNGWGSVADTKEVYLKNMHLSQERASNVLTICYGLDDLFIKNNIKWLEAKLRANGMAFSKPLYVDGSKTEDGERSKRVEFKVIAKDK
jgi:outer membrane protein OmpA-like peptidoglycan-associated protein